MKGAGVMSCIIHELIICKITWLQQRVELQRVLQAWRCSLFYFSSVRDYDTHDITAGTRNMFFFTWPYVVLNLSFFVKINKELLCVFLLVDRFSSCRASRYGLRDFLFWPRSSGYQLNMRNVRFPQKPMREFWCSIQTWFAKGFNGSGNYCLFATSRCV